MNEKLDSFDNNKVKCARCGEYFNKEETESFLMLNTGTFTTAQKPYCRENCIDKNGNPKLKWAIG